MNRFKNIFLLFIILSIPAVSKAVRIKDVANIKGVRDNSLIGYGLVIGLNGSGDDNKILPTIQSIATMLTKFGVKTAADLNSLKVENVAAVMVTANLHPFVKAGQKLDVTVSSIGNAKSLSGGTLLIAPLKGVDNKIYAVAQGPISVGGFAFGGSSGSKSQNHPTVGRIPQGAIVEREIKLGLHTKNEFIFSLHNPDFSSASQMSQTINKKLGGKFAFPLDAASVKVNLPNEFKSRQVEFLAAIESYEIAMDSFAKIVINERTGTVVMGENVKISTVAISHGNLNVSIDETENVSQAGAFAEGGKTVMTTDTIVEVKEEKPEGKPTLNIVKNGINIKEVVAALNAIGVSPRDLISILQAIKEAGALHAMIEVM